MATAADAQFDGPMGLALDPRGLLVADSLQRPHPSRHAQGYVTTLAGRSGPGLQDGLGIEAAFDTPTGIAVANGDVYVADTGNDVVRRIDRGRHRHHARRQWRHGRRAFRDRRGSRRRLMAASTSPIGARAILELLTGGRARAARRWRSGIRQWPRRPPSASGIRPVSRCVQTAPSSSPTQGIISVRLLDVPSRLGSMPPVAAGDRAGLRSARFARAPLIWPVDPLEGPHEVAGTIGEARGNAGGEGRERFHAGIDIHAPEGAEVFAVRDAKIDLPIAAGAFGLLNEFLSVGPVTYVHIRVARDRRGLPLRPDVMPLAFDAAGLPSRVRIRRGSRIRAGDDDRHDQPLSARAPERRAGGRGSQSAAGGAAAVPRHDSANDRPERRGDRRHQRRPHHGARSWPRPGVWSRQHRRRGLGSHGWERADAPTRAVPTRISGAGQPRTTGPRVRAALA